MPDCKFRLVFKIVHGVFGRDYLQVACNRLTQSNQPTSIDYFTSSKVPQQTNWHLGLEEEIKLYACVSSNTIHHAQVPFRPLIDLTRCEIIYTCRSVRPRKSVAGDMQAITAKHVTFYGLWI